MNQVLFHGKVFHPVSPSAEEVDSMVGCVKKSVVKLAKVVGGHTCTCQHVPQRESVGCCLLVLPLFFRLGCCVVVKHHVLPYILVCMCVACDPFQPVLRCFPDLRPSRLRVLGQPVRFGRGGVRSMATAVVAVLTYVPRARMSGEQKPAHATILCRLRSVFAGQSVFNRRHAVGSTTTRHGNNRLSIMD